MTRYELGEKNAFLKHEQSNRDKAKDKDKHANVKYPQTMVLVLVSIEKVLPQNLTTRV